MQCIILKWSFDFVFYKFHIWYIGNTSVLINVNNGPAVKVSYYSI